MYTRRDLLKDKKYDIAADIEYGTGARTLWSKSGSASSIAGTPSHSGRKPGFACRTRVGVSRPVPNHRYPTRIEATSTPFGMDSKNQPASYPLAMQAVYHFPALARSHR